MGWLILAEWHMNDGDHMDGGWALLMGAFMILVVAALVLLVVWLFRSASSSTAATPGRESAMDVLDRRLAAGEITPAEYRERAELLRH